MNILITGISSSLLTKVALELAKNHTISGISRNSNKINSKEDNIVLIEEDLFTISLNHPCFNNIDIFIHAAALTHSYSSELYFKSNVELTKKMVDITNLHSIKHFVFISSNTASKESGHYGYSKLLAEDYIKLNCKNWLILRPTEIYGSDKDEGIDQFVKKCFKNKFIFYPNNVPTEFYPIHEMDASETIKKLVLSNNVNKTIIVGGKKKYRFIEIINLIEKINGKRIYSISIPSWIMKLLKIFLIMSPFKVGIYPDQIDRLYSKKSVPSRVNFEKISFSEYLSSYKL